MKIEQIPLVMLECLSITILIETTISFLLKYRGKDILNIILVNIVTNPLVTSIPIYLNIHYGIKARNISLIALEAFTLLLEGYIYKKVLKNKSINPFILSLILNLSSYLIGVLINGF